MTIQESNKLIAVFMGAKIIHRIDVFTGKEIEWVRFEKGVFRDMVWDGSQDCASEDHPSALLYHKFWDWLIPVGKKIHDYLQGIERPSLNHCCKGDMIETDILCHLHTYNLEKVYEHIVLFIQWYNDFTSQPSNTK